MEYLSDLNTLFKRSMLHIFRSIDTIITVILQPVVIMLLFVYIFGGALDMGGSRADYVTYMLPGIFIMGIGSSVAYTALRINTDVNSGLFARFYSMPIAKSAILWSHVITSVISCAISIIAIIGVGFLIGFSTSATTGDWLIIIILLLLFTLALTWLALISGLAAKTPEAAAVFAYPIIFLPFISSAFVPTDTMPPVIKYIAEHQPVTYIVNTIRNLFSNQDPGSDLFWAFGWTIVILLICYVFANKIFKKKITTI